MPERVLCIGPIEDIVLLVQSRLPGNWKEIEEKMSVQIQACFGVKRLIKNSVETGNKLINLSLKNWLNIINKNGLFQEMKVLNWFSNEDHWFWLVQN